MFSHYFKLKIFYNLSDISNLSIEKALKFKTNNFLETRANSLKKILVKINFYEFVKTKQRKVDSNANCG